MAGDAMNWRWRCGINPLKPLIPDWLRVLPRASSAPLGTAITRGTWYTFFHRNPSTLLRLGVVTCRQLSENVALAGVWQPNG